MREYGFEMKKEFYLKEADDGNQIDDDDLIEKKWAELLHHLRAYTFEQDVGPPVLQNKP